MGNVQKILMEDERPEKSQFYTVLHLNRWQLRPVKYSVRCITSEVYWCHT